MISYVCKWYNQQHCSIFLPWCTVREVKVDVEVVSAFNLCNVLDLTSWQPSPKVAVIRFQRGMQQGLLARISRSSIMEYHAFGIIS
jgi:hypothetical protein